MASTADFDAAHGNVRLPHRWFAVPADGYRGGRPCHHPPPRERAVPRPDALLVGERRLVVRPAGPRDAAAARALHGRCSPATLQQRYLGPVGEVDRYLTHLLDPRFGHTLAAESPAGDLVALGHLLWDDVETEVALLVEDAWQRRGVGGGLLRRLVTLAAQAGCETVYAVTRPGNAGMVAAMRATGLPLRREVQEGDVVLSARLAPAAAGAGALPTAGGR